MVWHRTGLSAIRGISEVTRVGKSLIKMGKESINIEALPFSLLLFETPRICTKQDKKLLFLHHSKLAHIRIESNCLAKHILAFGEVPRRTRSPGRVATDCECLHE